MCYNPRGITIDRAIDRVVPDQRHKDRWQLLAEEIQNLHEEDTDQRMFLIFDPDDNGVVV